MKPSPLISIVDDDESVRESLESLLLSMGFRVAVFAGAEDFLDAGVAGQTDCLILDVRLDGMSGPELQQELKKGHTETPIVFVTAHGTEVLFDKLFADGAVECLLKPYSEQDLLGAVTRALGRTPQSSSE